MCFRFNSRLTLRRVLVQAQQEVKIGLVPNRLYPEVGKANRFPYFLLFRIHIEGGQNIVAVDDFGGIEVNIGVKSGISFVGDRIQGSKKVEDRILRCLVKGPFQDIVLGDAEFGLKEVNQGIDIPHPDIQIQVVILRKINF